MKKIAFIDETAKIGGAEMNLLRILPRLKQRGWEPELVVPEKGELVDKISGLGIPCHVVPGGPFFSVSAYIGNRWKLPNPFAWAATLVSGIRWAGALREALARIRPDVVQTVSLLSHVFGGWAFKGSDFPVVFHLQDIVMERSGFGLYPAFLRFVVGRFASEVVCVSPLVARQFRGKKVPGEKIKVVLNMVDSGNSLRDDGKRREGGTPRIGTVARLTPWKGQHVAIEAAGILKERGIEFEWVFVGDSTLGDRGYERRLRKRVEKLGLNEVRFAGWQERMENVYGSLDLLVHLPVEPEPFGLVIAEAMANGLPVVASPGGLDEIVKETGGVIVPPGDAAAAAAAVEKIVGDLSRLGGGTNRRHRRWVARKHFSPDAIIQQWTDLYDGLRAEKRG